MLRLILCLALFLAPAVARAQETPAVPASGGMLPDTSLMKRWVGNYLERPLTLEFYGDTMLVIGDQHALTYRLTYDSLIATGDTSIVARYRLARGRLLLFTPDGDVVTMAPQRTLGRPVTGKWVGDLDSSGTTIPVEVNLNANRTACWRKSPDGKWAVGEWDRETRLVTLSWDAGEWSGYYDPQGNSLLFSQAHDSTSMATSIPAPTGILRRVLRGTGLGQCPGR